MEDSSTTPQKKERKSSTAHKEQEKAAPPKGSAHPPCGVVLLSLSPLPPCGRCCFHSSCGVMQLSPSSSWVVVLSSLFPFEDGAFLPLSSRVVLTFISRSFVRCCFRFLSPCCKCCFCPLPLWMRLSFPFFFDVLLSPPLFCLDDGYFLPSPFLHI